MKPYAFGVDIGGTTVKIGLFETTGKRIDDWEIKTRTEFEGENILPDIAKAIKERCIKHGITNDQIEGIGMGVPGPVTGDGTVLKCINLGWDVFNVERRMNLLTGLKIKVANDANAAALGEMWQGGGKGYKDLVMVTLGTGVGGGVIIQGRILPGINGAAGEIGHMSVKDEETELCGCGKTGCLEQYASATGIVRMTKKYLAEHPTEESVLRAVPSLTAKNIFDAAKELDCAALTMVDQMGDILGKALASIACVVNPEAFVIGGGVSKAGNILIASLRTAYRKYAFHAAKETEFKLATLGNLAGIYGGVKMVIEE